MQNMYYMDESSEPNSNKHMQTNFRPNIDIPVSNFQPPKPYSNLMLNDNTTSHMNMVNSDPRKVLPPQMTFNSTRETPTISSRPASNSDS